jgi:hypothetical protein
MAETTKKGKKAPINNASKIIDRFGGIRPMAVKIDTPVTTVQGWKKRDVIPGTRRDQIVRAAMDNNIDISDLSDSSANSNASGKTASANGRTSSGSALKLKNLPPVEKKTDDKTTSSKKDSASQAAVTKNSDNAVPKKAASTSSEAEKDTSVPRTAASSNDTPQHDRLMAAMEAKSRKAMVGSAWITTGLILLASTVAAFLLWPSAQKKEQIIQEQSQKLVQLENELGKVNTSPEGQGGVKAKMLGALMPDNIQEKMDRLQNQARNIQNTVDQLSDRAEEISSEFSTSVLGPDAGPLSQRLEMLEEQISAMTGNNAFSDLVGRIKTLEESTLGQVQLDKTMTELQSLVQKSPSEKALNDDLAEAQENAKADGEDRSALGQTLEGVSGDDLKAAAMLVAFSQLRNTLNREEPFNEDLELLQGLVGTDNLALQGALEKLAPHANGGVLTAGGLSSEFRGLTGDIVASSLKGEDVSLKEKALARLNDVMQVEKNGESIMAANDTQKTVAAAQKMLDEGNIQEAINSLRRLDGEAAKEVQPFINQAEVSLLAEKVQTMMSDTILSKVTGGIPSIDALTGKIMGAPQGKQEGAQEGEQSRNSVADPADPAINLPLTSKIDLDAVKKNLEQAVPFIDGENKVIKDEASGISILPKQQGFKGFSAGE